MTLLKPERSIALALVRDPEDGAKSLEFESRWHLSQQFLAEERGEEVLADLIRLAPTRKARMILEAQVTDEQAHAALFGRLTERHGLDQRASHFARGYHDLVQAQATLSEKAFVFQILTESVSETYCTWRLGAYADSAVNEADAIVAADERRHIGMGKSLLSLCDADELAATLTESRRRGLVGKVATLCRNLMREGFVSALAEELGRSRDELNPVHPSDLDYAVVRSMIGHGLGVNYSVQEKLHE